MKSSEKRMWATQIALQFILLGFWFGRATENGRYNTMVASGTIVTVILIGLLIRVAYISGKRQGPER